MPPPPPPPTIPPPPTDGMRLNLGSGQHPQPGYINVDKFGSPDVRADLEQFPWPWPDSSVREIVLTHVLEHLGQSTDVFLGIVKQSKGNTVEVAHGIKAEMERIRPTLPHK